MSCELLGPTGQRPARACRMTALVFFAACCCVTRTDALVASHFPAAKRQSSATSSLLHASVASRSGRQPSRVSDPDGPTPDLQEDEDELIDPDEVDGLKEILSQSDMPRPVPHQPWRRGNLDGCDDPIDAEWRKEAERIIATAVEIEGGKLLDVTWYLTSMLVTLDEEISIHQRDLFKSEGPVIEVEVPRDPTYADPLDPNPPDISVGTHGVMYERETEEEKEESKNKESNRWAAKDEDDDPEETHNPLEDSESKSELIRNEVTRAEYAMRGFEDEKLRMLETPKPASDAQKSIHKVDTMALSTIAGSILGALEEVEEELQVLERHELVLASPGPPDVLETQKQFNAFRGENVIVETQDPWKSNRTLKGRLVDRNSMDVFINQKGRLVTIPNVFVKCVRIPIPPQEQQPTEGGEEASEEYQE
mmetsp:Transcript_17556/g.38293  ORF Transcript_17556/g.38293 Transcript_17556/m.38293 type:complete len:422 (+) Transcript_17556:116-1381(+)